MDSTPRQTHPTLSAAMKLHRSLAWGAYVKVSGGRRSKADASGLATDQLIGFDAPCSAWPPTFLCQVCQAATIESILLGLFEGLKHVTVRYGGVSARAASLDEGKALLAVCQVGSLCLAPRRRTQTQTDRAESKKESNSYSPIFLRPGPRTGEVARAAAQ